MQSRPSSHSRIIKEWTDLTYKRPTKPYFYAELRSIGLKIFFRTPLSLFPHIFCREESQLKKSIRINVGRDVLETVAQRAFLWFLSISLMSLPFQLSWCCGITHTHTYGSLFSPLELLTLARPSTLSLVQKQNWRHNGKKTKALSRKEV